MTTSVPRVRCTPRRIADTVIRTRTLGLFDEWAQRAERAVEVRLFNERMWLLTDPALARQALTAPPGQIGRSSRYRRMTALLGNSLLTTDGDEHRRRRRVIQPTFGPKHLPAYAPSIVAAAQETAASWRDGDVVRMEQEMAALTLSAIGRAVLGIDGRAEAGRIGGSLDRLQQAIALLLLPAADRLIQLRVPGLNGLRAAIADLHATAADATGSDAPLVAALRESAAQGALSDDDIRDELLTLLLAGHETTATTLTWAWWFLDRHPEVAERMRAEHDAALGRRPPTYDDVPALPLTTAVVAETLRLRPAAWIIEREVVGDVDLDGLRPDRGTVLAISPWILHRAPTAWADPHAFVPDRWLTAGGAFSEDAPGQPRGAWLPFGAGSHVCVGASFAWTEAVLVLATLSRDWSARATFDELPTRATATLRPARPVTMRVILRSWPIPTGPMAAPEAESASSSLSSFSSTSPTG